MPQLNSPAPGMPLDVLECMPEAFITLDREWRFTYINHHVEKHLGVNREEVLRKNIFDLIPFASKAPGLANIRKVMEEGVPATFDVPSMLTDKWFTVYVYPTNDGVAIFGSDITARKKAELAVEEQREWYETTLTSIGDAVIATDENGHVSFMNPVAEELTGWPVDDARGRPIEDVFNIVNELTREPVESPVQKVRREGKIVGLANHTLLIRRDGREIPIDDSGAPVKDSEGNLSGVVMVFHDITDRQLRENALRESEERFRTLADTAPVLIWMTDTDNAFYFFNKPWLRFTGRTVEQEKGDGWMEGVHPEDIDRSLDTRLANFEARKEFVLEYRLRRHDGEYRWVLDHGVPRQSEDGEFVGFIGSCIDITERFEVEAALRESEEQFRLALDAGKMGAWKWNLRTQASTWSETFERIHGWEPGTQSGQLDDYLTYVHPDDREAVGKAVERTLNHNEAYDIQYRFIRPDGSMVWLESVGQLETDRSGRPVRLAGICTDVTERRAAEDELRRSEERFRIAVEASPNAMLMVDETERIALMNEQAENLFGYERDELIGQPVEILIPPEMRDSYREHFLRDPQPRPMGAGRDLFGLRKDGREVPIEIGLSPIQTDTGTAVLSSIVDITERKNAEQALRHSEERLRRLNQTLEETVRERTSALLENRKKLRTLTSRLSTAEQQERRRVATDLHDNLAQLLAICKMKLAAARRDVAEFEENDDITDVVGCVDDALKYTRTLISDLSPPFDLGENDLANAIRWVADKIRKHGLNVTIEDHGTHKPVQMEVITTAVESVRELLFNVIRHSGTDEAFIRIQRGSDTVTVEVIDQGVGFEASMPRAQKDDGGFGLFSIHERLAALGSSFEVDTAPGKGTRAIITVPAAWGLLEKANFSSPEHVAPRAAETPRPTVGNEVRVLVVDDHDMMREGLRRVIDAEKDMMVIAEAADGDMAVRQALSHAPDVIVMDVGLPKLNGIEATRRITSNLPDVKIIALSMNETDEAQEAMSEAGATEYVYKTQAFDTLCAAIRKWGVPTRRNGG